MKKFSRAIVHEISSSKRSIRTIMKNNLTLLLAILSSLIVIGTVQIMAEDKPASPPAVGKVVKVGNTAPADAAVKEFDVSAKKYEFTPALIEAPANTLLKIHLKAIDKEHGFEIKGSKTVV